MNGLGIQVTLNSYFPNNLDTFLQQVLYSIPKDDPPVSGCTTERQVEKTDASAAAISWFPSASWYVISYMV
ncbi:Hypothetical protein KP2612_001659 [Komagataella phaffii]